MHRDNPAIPVGEFVECLNEHLRAGRIRAFGGSNWTIPAHPGGQRLCPRPRAGGLCRLQPQPGPGRLERADVERLCGRLGLGLARLVYADTDAALCLEQPGFGAFHRPAQARGPQQPGPGRGRAHLVQRRTTSGGWSAHANWRAKKGVTSTQIALAYVLCQPFPTYALIGPRTIEETRTSIEALRVSLTPEELRWLNLEE